VAFLAGVVSGRDLPPGQAGELGAQAGLVAFDGDQVMRATLAGQVLGVGARGLGQGEQLADSGVGQG
jgi:hypothetical protein